MQRRQRKHRCKSDRHMMSAADLLNTRQLAGVLLILSFILFAIGGILPIIGDKGNVRIFNLPAREQLLAVAAYVNIWRWANIFMGIAAIVLMAGLPVLTTLLNKGNELILSHLGLMGFLLATILWVIFSVFRSVVTVDAAMEVTASGTLPAYYQPLARWAFALFYVYAVLGYLALGCYGAALLQVDILPAWIGWVALLINILFLIHLLITGDTLPAFHYLSPLLIGIVLSWR